MKSVATITIGVILFAAMVVIPTMKDVKDRKVYKEVESTILPDVNMLSSIIQAECGNCSQSEKYLVGSVVLNRVKSPLWPNTMYEVINQPNQFQGKKNKSDLDTDAIANNLLTGLYVTPDIYYFCTKTSVNRPMDTIVIEGEFHIFGK